MTCKDCVITDLYKDGYCESHWKFRFGGMTNHERMHEKLRIRSPEQYAKLVALLKKS